MARSARDWKPSRSWVKASVNEGGSVRGSCANQARDSLRCEVDCDRCGGEGGSVRCSLELRLSKPIARGLCTSPNHPHTRDGLTCSRRNAQGALV